MKEKKEIKSKVWMYAVVLFTSAFIVLLFTAFSQIRLNNNIEDYRNQLSSQAVEKSKFQLSYENALERLDELEKETALLKEESKTLQLGIDEAKQEIAAKQQELNSINTAYENFVLLQELYNEGKATESASMIIKVDKSMLSDGVVSVYDKITPKILDAAGEELFKQGYELYYDGDYTEAIIKLDLSRQYAIESSYSARCLYYAAYSRFRIGQKAYAFAQMKELIQEYPESKYAEYAKDFLKKQD